MKNKLLLISAILLSVLLMSACSGETAGTNGVSDYSGAAKLLTEVKTTQFFTEEKVADEDIDKILSAGVNAPSAMNTQPWHFTAVTDEETNEKLANAMGSMMPPAMKDGEAGKAPVVPEEMKGQMPSMPEGAEGQDFPIMPEKMNGGQMPSMPEGAEGQPPAGFSADAPNPPEGGTGFSKAAGKAGIGDAPLTIVISCKEGSELDAGLAVQNMSAEAQLLGYGTKIMTAPTMSLNNDEYKTLLSVPEGQKIVAVLIVGKTASAEEKTDTATSATTRNNFNDVVTIIA